MADLGWWFYALMAIVLIGLIVLFLYLRKKEED
jgi:LPXTG-motif cell wall-anchored protein